MYVYLRSWHIDILVILKLHIKHVQVCYSKLTYINISIFHAKLYLHILKLIHTSLDAFNDCLGCPVEDRDVVGVPDLFVAAHTVHVLVRYLQPKHKVRRPF